ncbi:MAG: CDP-alcohol phosphatidyltransferase family protein [Cyanobacteria bacterium]|nr:CDP-alcohol phosphatidyltransferase family protein [Cyanobacteriota bacterium]
MANLVSLFRTLLCFLTVALLFAPGYEMYITCFVLTVIVIWMDGLDGYVARKFNESSKIGALVDILSDRVVEQVYWVSFLSLGWVPLWIPLVVIVRGVVVDGFRSLAFEQGYTAFGQTSMMQSPLGILLVSSRFSRWTYAVTKAVAFSFLILAKTPNLDPSVAEPCLSIAMASVYGAVFFCVVRGLPVLIESSRFFGSPKQN